MKKWLICFMIMLMSVCLAACGLKDNQKQKKIKTNVEATESIENTENIVLDETEKYQSNEVLVQIEESETNEELIQTEESETYEVSMQTEEIAMNEDPMQTGASETNEVSIPAEESVINEELIQTEELETNEEPIPADSSETETNEDKEKTVESNKMKIQIGSINLTVTLENNTSVDSLKELLREAPLTIEFSQYGGFEQVGNIGTNLPENNTQITTSAGDIVLYGGNQMVMFYGSNSWSYTKLGVIDDLSQEELTELLEPSSVTATFSLE